MNTEQFVGYSTGSRQYHAAGGSNEYNLYYKSSSIPMRAQSVDC